MWSKGFLSLVEGVAEAVWCAIQREFSWWQEPVGTLCGLVLSVLLLLLLMGRGLVVVDSGNVIVLLTDGSWWSGCGVLIVVVLGWGRGAVVVLDWSRATITLISWIVPSLVISSIVELVGLVILIDVVALSLVGLILWLNSLRDWLWWCRRSDGQVVSGSLEAAKRGSNYRTLIKITLCKKLLSCSTLLLL